MNACRKVRTWMATAAALALAATALAAGDPTAKGPAPAGNPIAVLEAVERAFVEVARRVSPSVVSISVTRKAGARPEWLDRIPDEEWRKYFGRPKDEFEMPETLSAGSGIIIGADGFILTNYHVVEDAREIQVRLADGRPFKATLVKADPRSDLAVIRIPAKGLTVAKFNASGKVEVGQWVIALGNPFGFGRDGRATLTHGVVSAVGRNLPFLGRLDDRYYGHLIQTDAPINPGNSGGALLNIRGEVIGINTAIYSTSRGSQGIGFAIPIDEKTMAIIAKLKRGEEVEYGYLGVGIRAVSEEEGRRLGVPPRRGALVARVEPGTPAEKAGLKKDDVIVEFNGRPVPNEDELIREVGSTPVGSRVRLRVIREGREVELEATLAKRDIRRLARTRPAPSGRRSRPAEPRRHSWRGITVQPLTEELARRLGLPEAKGVLVADCRKGSPAWRAGIRAGFVIDQIGKEPVRTVADFRRVTSALPEAWKGLVHTNNGFYVVGPK